MTNNLLNQLVSPYTGIVPQELVENSLIITHPAPKVVIATRLLDNMSLSMTILGTRQLDRITPGQAPRVFRETLCLSEKRIQALVTVIHGS